MALKLSSDAIIRFLEKFEGHPPSWKKDGQDQFSATSKFFQDGEQTF